MVNFAENLFSLLCSRIWRAGFENMCHIFLIKQGKATEKRLAVNKLIAERPRAAEPNTHGEWNLSMPLKFGYDVSVRKPPVQTQGVGVKNSVE